MNSPDTNTGTSLAYSVTALTLAALFRARKIQAQDFRTRLNMPDGMAQLRALLSACSSPMTVLSAAGSPSWANVRFVNGETHECALPLSKLIEWAKGADALTLKIMPNLRFKFTRDQSSSVVFYGHPVTAPAARNSRGILIQVPRRLLGSHLTLTAPAAGGEFLLQSSTTN